MWTAVAILVGCSLVFAGLSRLFFFGAAGCRENGDLEAAVVGGNLGCLFGGLFLVDVFAVLVLLTWIVVAAFNG